MMGKTEEEFDRHVHQSKHSVKHRRMHHSDLRKKGDRYQSGYCLNTFWIDLLTHLYRLHLQSAQCTGRRKCYGSGDTIRRFDRDWVRTLQHLREVPHKKNK